MLPDVFSVGPEGAPQDDGSRWGASVFDGFAAMANRLGFDYCAYAARLPFQVCEPVLLAFSNYPQSWQNRYRRNGYAESDPVIRQAIASSEPVLWSDELFAAASEFRLEARACGLNHGWSKAIHDPRGIVGIFSVARAYEAIDGDEIRQKLPHLLWLAHATHEEMCRRILADGQAWQASAKLSCRETEILRQSADGKTVGDIALLMNISERTVNFHVNNAIAKLGVRNKTHAVARAIRLGLLD